MRLLRHFSFAVAIVLNACAGEENGNAGAGARVDTLPGGIPRIIASSPADSGRWHLAVARNIQPPELDSAELGNPRDIALADDGTLFVSDANPTVIKVFARNGQLLRLLGREGEGPGEFREPYIAVAGDTLIAQDPAIGRATSFNWRTGQMLTERRTACCYFGSIGIDASNRAAVRMMTQPDSTLPNVHAFVRFQASRTAAETVRIPSCSRKASTPQWVLRRGNQVFMTLLVPYQPRAFHVVDPGGSFLTAFSSDYSLVRTTTGLDSTAVFGRIRTSIPISADEKSRIAERRVEEVFRDNEQEISKSTIRAGFDPSLIPDARPAFEGVWVDRAARTWVQVGTRDTSVVQLDLFDRDGRWLDAITVPAASWLRSPYRPAAFASEEIAVAIEGEDGRPLVRIFRVERR